MMPKKSEQHKYSTDRSADAVAIPLTLSVRIPTGYYLPDSQRRLPAPDAVVCWRFLYHRFKVGTLLSLPLCLPDFGGVGDDCSP